MFKNFRVRNFRGLYDLSIEKTGHINLIAGRNNSGKTTLLEAIFLLSGWGNPELVQNINAHRGMASAFGSAETLRNFFWKPLFSALDIEKKVEISGRFAPLGQLDLKIALSQAKTTEIRLDGSEQISTTRTPDQDTLEVLFIDGSDREFKGSIRPAGQGLQVERPNVRVQYPATFLSSHTGSPSGRCYPTRATSHPENREL